MTVNIAVLVPIPRARVTRAVAVKAGFLRMIRRAWKTSRPMASGIAAMFMESSLSSASVLAVMLDRRSFGLRSWNGGCERRSLGRDSSHDLRSINARTAFQLAEDQMERAW